MTATPINVSIVGASGLTGAECVKFLLRHPHVNLKHLAVRQDPKPRFSDLYPEFKGQVDQLCCDIDPAAIAKDSDVIFLTLPHKVSQEVMAEFLRTDKLIIDLSADFRLDDADVYAKAYGQTHLLPSELGHFVYGLCEVNREQIKKARRIANPGCFPTATLLGLYPVMQAGWGFEQVIVDAKTGVSGGGRNPAPGNSLEDMQNNFKAYKVAVHQHQPEMEQELAKMAGDPVSITFVPHLLPIYRGILATLYVTLDRDLSEEDMKKRFAEAYVDCPFVKWDLTQSPELRSVENSNDCHIFIKKASAKQWVIVSAIDNLVKGASGQAVQNMNIALGYDEREGLI